jgi:hypothetical protein
MGQPNDAPEEEVKEVVPEVKPEEQTKEVVPEVKEETPADDVRNLIGELNGRIDELAASVASLLEKGEPDSSPVKGPWTERKLF